LKAIRGIVDVPEELVWKGECALSKLLPRESATKETDLALLSLIYPYAIVTPEQRDVILDRVERLLVRERGVCRYLGDRYYNEGGEAEWTMGLAWLAVIYRFLNIPHKHAFYMTKCVNALNERGELPELYFANSSVHNDNTPLAWAQSLMVVAAA
jgi:phosphorylase kinase alpha/beta subunit